MPPESTRPEKFKTFARFTGPVEVVAPEIAGPPGERRPEARPAIPDNPPVKRDEAPPVKRPVNDPASNRPEAGDLGITYSGDKTPMLPPYFLNIK